MAQAEGMGPLQSQQEVRIHSPNPERVFKSIRAVVPRLHQECPCRADPRGQQGISLALKQQRVHCRVVWQNTEISAPTHPINQPQSGGRSVEKCQLPLQRSMRRHRGAQVHFQVLPVGRDKSDKLRKLSAFLRKQSNKGERRLWEGTLQQP